MDDTKRALFWTAWPRQLLNTLPCTCQICARPAASLFCAQCQLQLAHNDRCCVQCAEELPATQGQAKAPQSQHCGRCISNPPPFQRTLFAYDYDGPIPKLIQRFKYSEALILNQLLADMIVNSLKEYAFPLPDALIPVPLHPVRLKQRGFNQSLELAIRVGKTLNIPVHAALLIRTRNTPNQSGLDHKAREQNIRGAFRFQADKGKTHFAGKHLAIVDDVITTGSTAREVAKALKSSGAARISVIAVAKTRKSTRYNQIKTKR